MSVIQVKRGDIHYANLDPVVGRETGKTRPVLVIQNDIGNMYSPTTIVAIITEYSEKKASYPICVAIKRDLCKTSPFAQFQSLRGAKRRGNLVDYQHVLRLLRFARNDNAGFFQRSQEG